MSGTDESAPLVSIGLAVYNGERYLDEAIRSILAQTYTNLELIISDNASTDATEAMCRSYAAQDARIRYSRNPTNIGGANNENLTFKLSRGKYFRWAAHDDVCAPELIEQCVRVLEARPEVVLCHSFTNIIDMHGAVTEALTRSRAQSSAPSQRFWDMMRGDHMCEETYGVMRSAAVAQTGLQRNYTDSDRTMLAHLALLGPYAVVPTGLFFKRVHPDMSTQAFPNWRQRMAWFGAEYESGIQVPNVAQFRHYLEIIATSAICRTEKVRCLRYLATEWLYWKWRPLAKDLLLLMYREVRSLMAALTPNKQTDRSLP